MLKLGIIGVGGWGRKHVQGFQSLQAEGRVRIAAMADVSPGAFHDLTTLPEDVRCCTDYRDLLAIPGLDAVVVNVPIPFHREITLAALERDLFILLEKPPVPLLSQLEELIHADRYGRVMVAFQHMYSPLVEEAKACILRGRLGRLGSVSALGIWPRPTYYYERAGWAGELEWQGRPVLDGPCTNAFAHYINLALYLCGDSDSFAAPLRLRGEAYRARPQLSGYDTALLSGTLEGGISFAAGFTHAASEPCRVTLRVTGDKGELSFSNDCETLQLPDGTTLLGGDGQSAMWRAFLTFAEGDSSQNRTPLHAAKPFLLANNLMFQSSGGIHAIPEKFVQVSGADGRTIFAIDGIGHLLRHSTDRFLPLGEMGVDWAIDPPLIDASDFLEHEMLASLDMPAGRSSMAVPLAASRQRLSVYPL